MGLSKYPILVQAKRQLLRELFFSIVLLFGGAAVVFVVTKHFTATPGLTNYLLVLVVVLLCECLVELRNIRDSVRQLRDKI
jgi:hypothetical protein